MFLPPHLSPFTRDGEGDYVPPDKYMLMDESKEEKMEEEVNPLSKPLSPKKQKVYKLVIVPCDI